MARSVRAPVETRSRRLRLEARKRPYWATIEKGLAVGYHRPVGGAPEHGGPVPSSPASQATPTRKPRWRVPMPHGG